MRFLNTLKSRATQFWQDKSGVVTVEFVVFVPFLLWTYAASYMFFDAYRQSSLNLKAAYTIGDMISRETQIITPEYIDSMYNITQLLTRTTNPMSMRITVVRWDEEDDQYYLDWSQVRGSAVALTETDLADIADRLPVMPDDERVILVETWNTWTGLLNTAIGTISMDNFVFTRPRFAPQVIFES